MLRTSLTKKPSSNASSSINQRRAMRKAPRARPRNISKSAAFSASNKSKRHTSAPVGSLLSEGLSDGGDFQRVADDEEVAPPAARRTPQVEAAHVDHFVDEVAHETSRDFSFQRVSDDEQAQAQAEPVKESPLPA